MHIVKNDEFWHLKVNTDVQDSDMYKTEKKKQTYFNCIAKESKYFMQNQFANT